MAKQNFEIIILAAILDFGIFLILQRFYFEQPTFTKFHRDQTKVLTFYLRNQICAL